MTKIILLKNFPQHAMDDNGFLYRLGKTMGAMKPIAPRLHHLAGDKAPVNFYITHVGVNYKIAQTELIRDKEHTRGTVLS